MLQEKSAVMLQEKSAEMLQEKSAAMLQEKSAVMLQEKSAVMLQEKPAVMPQEESAVMPQEESVVMPQEESAVMPPVENSQGSGSLPLQTPLYSLNAVELVVLQTIAALGDGDSSLLSQLGLDCPEKKLARKGQDQEGSQDAWPQGAMQKARWSWKH